MSEPALGRAVLVPVANPTSVRPLLHMAAQIARADGGHVRVITILPETAPADEHAYTWQGLADAEALAPSLGVPVHGRVVHASQPAAGVLDTMRDSDVSLVLMGWRGISSTTDVFGLLIDRIVGHSTVPLGIVRLGTADPLRVLLPVSSDHLLPGGGTGLQLAAGLARRLAEGLPEPTTILRTGSLETSLPDEVAALGSRVHHDPRRTHQAVEAFASRDDLIVAAVAPTVSGLRGATTHLAWAAPDATLLVAVDVGPQSEPGLAGAVEDAGAPAPASTAEEAHTVRIMVTARLPEAGELRPETFEKVLRVAGTTENVMAWWPTGDDRPQLTATVCVEATGPNRAIAAIMSQVHDAPELRGAEISYDVERRVDR